MKIVKSTVKEEPGYRRSWVIAVEYPNEEPTMIDECGHIDTFWGTYEEACDYVRDTIFVEASSGNRGRADVVGYIRYGYIWEVVHPWDECVDEGY